MGLSGAFPGTSFTALINLSWACLVFEVIPAPLPVVLFGVVRRALAGLMSLQDGFVVLFYSYSGRGLKRVQSADSQGGTPYLIL